MPADLDYIPPYPSGWRDKPSTLTAIAAAALDQMDDGILAATVRAALSVRFDDAQGLTGPEQAQARMNIHAVATVNGTAPDAFGNVSLGPGAFYEIEDQGDLTGADDSALIQAAIDASIAGAGAFGPAPVRGRQGVVYRAKQINVTGAWLQFRGSGIKHPDGGTGHNVLTATGPFRLEGGDFDANKANVTDAGTDTDGCGLYVSTTSAGWSGTLEIIGARFHDSWRPCLHISNTDSTLHDGLLAPWARVYLERVETDHSNLIGQRFTGIRGIKRLACRSHDNVSHGNKFFLCYNPVAIDCEGADNSNGHGHTSLYSVYEEIWGGVYNNNQGTHDGIVIGGDSTSPTNEPGRWFTIIGAKALGNGNHGIVHDASITGGTGPVPTWGKIIGCTANSNTNEGIIVTSGQFAQLIGNTADENGGHGVELVTANATVRDLHAHNNGQRPLALEGSAPDGWGDHDIGGTMDFGGNTPDDLITYGAGLVPCRFNLGTYARRTVTAAMTAKIGEALNLDTSAGTFAVTLPVVANGLPGRISLVWMLGTTPPTLVRTGTDKFDTPTNSTPPVFTALGQIITLESDGAGQWTNLAVPSPPALQLRGTIAPVSGNIIAPTTGGRGSGGVPAQGDAWFTTGTGNLGDSDLPATGVAIEAGDLLWAKRDNPGSGSPFGWAVAESKTHKDTDVFMVSNSDTFYPSQKAVKTYIDTMAALKANLASPALTGNPTAPTQTPGDNSTKLANTAFVAAAIAALVNSAPGILDTLGEIATALQADESTAAALATTVAGKQPLDATLTALAALTTAADKLIYATGADTFSQTTLTSFIRTLLDDPDLATALATLGIDTDTTLANNSDTRFPSQKAIKAYVDTLLANNQTGTTYTLALADWGKVVELNNASAIALTVPLNATLALPVGYWMEGWVQGAGQVTIAPESGSVNLRCNGGKLKSNGQFSSFTARKRATDEWAITGDLTT